MLSHVYVTQMTLNGVEGHLNGVDMSSFATSGFTAQKWIASAKSTAYKFAQAFPEKPIVFEIHEIDRDTIIPATIMNELYNDPNLCQRIGLGMWWISGKTTYQPGLIDYIEAFQGDKYAQVIGRSDQVQRFKDSLYCTVFAQAKQLGIRYIEPWPYEFQYHTYDSIIRDFNMWADVHFSPGDTCTIHNRIDNGTPRNLEVLICPNPTDGKLNLHIDAFYKKLEVMVFDSTGHLLISKIDQTEIDISHLAKGKHIVKIIIDKEMVERKIIKI